MTPDFLSTPIDPTAAANLSGHGLRFALLDPKAQPAREAWQQAVMRGFHSETLTPEAMPARLEPIDDRRASGVWDDSSADPETPVATASSWIIELTVPGERSVPAWAISTITVAPTHRRRGIARNLLEAELRTAAGLGVPVAILTATEATIYERYGFAPSTLVADWRIDTQRARWTGQNPTGRVQLVQAETVRDGGGLELLEWDRLRVPGQLRFDGILWQRLFGMPGTDEGTHVRVARYDDENGTPQGFVSYRVDRKPEGSALEVKFLLSATDDAYAALWRYVLEFDLVTEVTAQLRPVDEPLTWQVSDARAVHKTAENDHLWTRILDVKAALEARRYPVPGRILLDVADPLGFAAGRFLLDIAADGGAEVSAVSGPVPDAAALALSVNELGAIYLGGVSAARLVRAGRIRELTPGAADAADASFRSAVTPWLGIWF